MESPDRRDGNMSITSTDSSRKTPSGSNLPPPVFHSPPRHRRKAGQGNRAVADATAAASAKILDLGLDESESIL